MKQPSRIARMRWAGLVVALMLHPTPAVTAAPSITSLLPAAAKPGTTTLVTLRGENLAGATELWTSFPAAVARVAEADPVQFKLTLPTQTSVGVGAVRLITTNGMSGLMLILVDTLPASSSHGTNHSLATAQRIANPGAVDGNCEGLLSDFFRFTARKGERASIEAVAQRLGSPLDPWIRVLDSQGRELAFNDDISGLGVDARIEFRCPTSGDYCVEIRDTRHAGGAQHRYRLRLGPPLPVPLSFLSSPDLARFTSVMEATPVAAEREPNDDISRAQFVQTPVEVAGRFARDGDRDVYEFQANKGERWVFRGQTRSLGSPCDLLMRLESTNGMKIAEANATSSDDGALTNRFPEGGTYRVILEELNRGGGSNFLYRLAIRPFVPGFTLSTETERISAPAGEDFTIEVRAERRDYDGPIEFGVVDSTGHIQMTNARMSGKTNVARITLKSAEELPLGGCVPFSLTGSARVLDSTVTERVSTLPALRNAFPSMMHPPRQFDGLIHFSVAESKSSSPGPSGKKKKRK